MKTKQPVLGIILDGFGVRKGKDGNPFYEAQMPFYQSLLKKYPHTTINASGAYVGLPDGQMGNSEVGHINLGAGRIVYQDFMCINNAIKDKSLQHNKILVDMLNRAEKKQCTLHLIGLVSDGGIHSSINHLLALLDIITKYNIKDVKVHCITDGRDTPVESGKGFVKTIEERLNKDKLGSIATIIGRFYAMDREQRWARTQEAFDLFVYGKAKFRANTFDRAFDVAYGRKVSDEYIPSFAIGGYDGMSSGDEVLFFNFRPDRMRQITAAFASSRFNKFARGKMPKIKCTAMCVYDDKQANLPALFGQEFPHNTLSMVVSRIGYRQLKVAETTKYAHVTYYFNGGVEKPYKNEDRTLIESAYVDDFATFPQMRAREIAQELALKLCDQKYDLIIANFSNADMVGHRGNMQASIKTLEVLDECLKIVVTAAQNNGVVCVITADHGNIEDMRVSNGRATTHTTNPVPFIIADNNYALKKGDFGLDCFAPTILDIMGIPRPKDMTGPSIVAFDDS